MILIKRGVTVDEFITLLDQATSNYPPNRLHAASRNIRS